MRGQKIDAVLDRFSAFQLRSAFDVVRHLITWSEEKIEKGDALFDLPMENFTKIGIRPEQIRSAFEIFEQVHQSKYGDVALRGGGLVASQPPPGPSIKSVKGKEVIRGLVWIPLRELDVTLSQRSGVAPAHLFDLRYSLKDGIHLLNSSDRPCPLTPQEYKCLSAIHVLGNATLKGLGKHLKATDQNVSRCINEINRAFMSAFKSGDKLIVWRKGVGFFLNQARFSISGS